MAKPQTAQELAIKALGNFKSIDKGHTLDVDIISVAAVTNRSSDKSADTRIMFDINGERKSAFGYMANLFPKGFPDIGKGGMKAEIEFITKEVVNRKGEKVEVSNLVRVTPDLAAQKDATAARMKKYGISLATLD